MPVARSSSPTCSAPKRSVVERRGEAIGGEGDRAAVGRPRRMQIGEHVGGQLRQPPRSRACRRTDPTARPSAPRQHDPRAVGRPAAAVDLADRRAAAPPRAGRRDRGRSSTSTGLPPRSAVIAKRRPDGVPGAGRVDVLQAVEVRIGRGADDLADDARRCRCPRGTGRSTAGRAPTGTSAAGRRG